MNLDIRTEPTVPRNPENPQNPQIHGIQNLQEYPRTHNCKMATTPKNALSHFSNFSNFSHFSHSPHPFTPSQSKSTAALIRATRYRAVIDRSPRPNPRLTSYILHPTSYILHPTSYIPHIHVTHLHSPLTTASHESQISHLSSLISHLSSLISLPDTPLPNTCTHARTHEHMRHDTAYPTIHVYFSVPRPHDSISLSFLTGSCPHLPAPAPRTTHHASLRYALGNLAICSLGCLAI